MESTKKNTLVFEFPKDAPGPTLIEMSRFVKNFGADRSTMDTCYRNADEKCIFIRFKSAESFNDAIMDNPEVLTFRYSDGNTVPVKMSVAGGFNKYVRIFNLPPEVGDDEINRALSKYGKIQKMIREKFPPECELDLFSGIRGVYMDIQRPIPAALFIRNCKARIYYEGFKNRCFHCMAEDHQKRDCPQLSELRREDSRWNRPLEENPVTFAKVLASSGSALAARLEAARSSSGDLGSKKANEVSAEERENSGHSIDGDSFDDDLFDDVEKEENAGEMEVDVKGSGSKRALTGVPSSTESEESNSGTRRSEPKRQKNRDLGNEATLEDSPLEAIQNVPRDKAKEDSVEQQDGWKVSQTRRSNSKRSGKR